ncbi:MAG: agmatinase family protein [Actinomycetota bacterium]
MNLENVPYLRAIDRPVERAGPADPLFPRASEVIADKVLHPVALLVGVPYSGGSLSQARCDGAPSAVRGMLSRFSSYSSDFGVSLDIASILDVGDVEAGSSVSQTQAHVETCLRELSVVSNDLPIAILGGDNSITAGCVSGTNCDALVTFDAHHDVRDGFSNGSPVRQVLEAGVPGERIVQIGIHGFANSRAYSERAAAAGITWVSAATVREHGMESIVDQTFVRLASNAATRVWVDFDIDCLDRSFAPGAAASMPGGLMPFDLELAAFACGASPLVRGIDITEVDPSSDVGGVTVRTACAILLSFYAGVMSR